jgi:hypothetical protein
MVAPFLPHALQRARCLSRSLDTSAPHRMTATAQASGAWCWQRSHQSHTQGVARCRSPRVGIGPGCMVVGCYRLPAIASALRRPIVGLAAVRKIPPQNRHRDFNEISMF